MDAVIMPSGKFKHRPIVQVPTSYLVWMVGSGHAMAEQAQAELDRRNQPLPTFDVTDYAVDQASLRVIDVWQRTMLQDEGIKSWLDRMGRSALRDGVQGSAVIWYEGVGFVVEYDHDWPTLKTVVRGYQKS